MWHFPTTLLALCSLAHSVLGSTAHIPYQDAPSDYPGSPWVFPAESTRSKVCHVVPAPNGGDSAPAILDAFSKCGQNGKVIFDNKTYHVNSVMTTTGLHNVEVDIRGTLLWGTNISYWLNHSLPMGYQNQCECTDACSPHRT